MLLDEDNRRLLVAEASADPAGVAVVDLERFAVTRVLSGGDRVALDTRRQRAIVGNASTGYLPGEGIVVAGQGASYSGKTLLDMARGDFSDARTLAESKQLMRGLINHYLGDKPLMTRQLLIDLQSL